MHDDIYGRFEAYGPGEAEKSTKSKLLGMESAPLILTNLIINLSSLTFAFTFFLVSLALTLAPPTSIRAIKWSFPPKSQP